MITTIMTKHYVTRAKERAGLNEREAERLAGRAMEKGKVLTEYHAKERKYISNHSDSKNTIIRIYNNYCFIFSLNGVCITLFALPEWFGRKRRYADNKSQIKHTKRYYRNYPMYLQYEY